MNQAEIARRHQRVFTLLADAIHGIEDVIDTLEIPDEGQKLMVGALCQRLVTGSQACLLLGKEGLAAELNAQARVCLETFFNLKALSSNPDLVAVYAGESLTSRERILKGITRDLRESFSPSVIAEKEADLAAVTEEIAARGVKKYSAAAWAHAAGCASLYPSAYALGSLFVHSNPGSLREWVVGDAAGNLQEIVRGPTDVLLATTLVEVARLLVSAIDAVGQVFGLEVGPTVLTLNGRVKTLSEAVFPDSAADQILGKRAAS